jgi:hypothetical protein
LSLLMRRACRWPEANWMACELGQEIADYPIETCSVARMRMICLLA